MPAGRAGRLGSAEGRAHSSRPGAQGEAAHARAPTASPSRPGRRTGRTATTTSSGGGGGGATATAAAAATATATAAAAAAAAAGGGGRGDAAFFWVEICSGMGRTAALVATECLRLRRLRLRLHE